MSPGQISQTVVARKLELVARMLAGIGRLPLQSESSFVQDLTVVAAGESFLRRALEALLDLGRHVLAKGFGIPAAEFKAIPRELARARVLDQEHARRLHVMAGYRNRLVHLYDEITAEELYGILRRDLDDVEAVCEAIRSWLKEHSDKVDPSL